jgi:uncharacterized SAM-dependent methyltransferase
MLTFKHVEVAQKYGVSEVVVRKWVGLARAGKLKLALQNENGIDRILNTSSNVALLEQLVSEGKKFRNTRAFKTISPQPAFYKLYNQAQMYDIVTNLEMYHEIPRQYNYFDGGADNWDKYMKRLMADDGPTQPKMTIKLLSANQGYLDDLLAPYKRVNVVDVGVGNAVPVKGLLAHLLDQGKLGCYIAMDTSAAMIDMARRNVQLWYDGRVNFQGYEADINYERFGNLLAEDALTRGQETVNLVLFLGGTPGNLRNPDGAFRMIHDSMGPNDLLVFTDKLDTEASRRYFDWNIEPGATKLAPNHRFILDLLNIDPAFYDIEMGFSKGHHNRYVRVRLKIALAIRFHFDAGDRVLELDRGATILLLRVWGNSAKDVWQVFDRNHFYTLQSSQSKDRQYILTISCVKAE